jgi:hypothetical protein
MNKQIEFIQKTTAAKRKREDVDKNNQDEEEEDEMIQNTIIEWDTLNNITLAEKQHDELENKEKADEDENEENNEETKTNDEAVKEILAKRYKQMTTCVNINNEWIEITTLKLQQLKDQLKARSIKFEGNKEKLLGILKEVLLQQNESYNKKINQ